MTYHSNKITLFSDIDKDRLSDFVESVFLFLKTIFDKILLYSIIVFCVIRRCEDNSFCKNKITSLFQTSLICLQEHA